MPTNPKSIKAYNDNAEFYDAHVKDPEDSLYHTYYETPAMRAEFPKLEGLDVISIACGSDEDGQWFLNNGVRKLVGIDISEKLIEIAKKNNPTVEYHVMDMEILDFEDKSFDFAYSSLAIEYIDDWVKALKEAYRILRSGSKYVFSCNHPIETGSEYFRDNDNHGALLGRETNDTTGEVVIHGDYLTADTNGIRQINSILPDSYIYHRPMSKMVKDIIDSGFEIKKMIEPLPLEALKEKSPSEYNKMRKIPVFVIWVLQK